MGQVGIRLDPHRKQPLHRQIFDEVVMRIESRAFPPGFKLPPTRVLARELDTHRNTVARAYGDLQAAGFVSSTVGRGTFVEQRAPSLDPHLPLAASETGSARELPWEALLSHAARSDALGRSKRHVRATGQRDVVNLARMQPSPDLIPDELLSRCIAYALSEHGPQALSYAPIEGTPGLREQIVRDLAERGVPARSDEVLVTGGSQQGLDLVARALLNPGDALLVEPTTYSGAIDLFTLAGARVVAVPVDAEGPDPDALGRLSRQDVKALYLMPNAHNPSGRTLPAERRRALVKWSRDAGIPIIEDDYAAGLSLEDRRAPPHLRALDGEVIHISTLSKRLAPGLRLGYVVVPARLRPVLGSLKHLVDLGSSLLLQHAVAEFMERGYLRAHSRRINVEYRKRRDVLHEALRKNLPRSVSWQLPTQGVVMWLQLPRSLDALAVYEEALRRGVLVSPSPVWSVAPHAEPAVRLAFCGEPAERVAEGARRLSQAIKHLLSRTRGEAPAADADPILEVV